MFPPAVVVHGLDHARLALSLRRPVCLLSGPGAGRYAGVGWWRALIAAASDTPPVAGSCDVLDCDDAPGAAMAALRHRQIMLILDPRCPAFRAVVAAAGTCGATVLEQRPQALDLGERGAGRALGAWLAAPG